MRGGGEKNGSFTEAGKATATRRVGVKKLNAHLVIIVGHLERYI